LSRSPLVSLSTATRKLAFEIEMDAMRLEMFLIALAEDTQ